MQPTQVSNDRTAAFWAVSSAVSVVVDRDALYLVTSSTTPDVGDHDAAALADGLTSAVQWKNGDRS